MFFKLILLLTFLVSLAAIATYILRIFKNHKPEDSSDQYGSNPSLETSISSQRTSPSQILDSSAELTAYTFQPTTQTFSNLTFQEEAEETAVNQAKTPLVRESLPEEKLNELTRLVSEIPPLPFNTASILGELRGARSNPRNIRKLVGQDPVLSAMFLRMANSSYYAQATEITSLDRALLLLGNDVLLSVALRGALAGLVSRTNPGGYNPNALLRHNVATGLWAGALARRTGRVDPHEAVTAGLLHDLGKMVLNSAKPVEVRNILDIQTTILGESRLAKEERIIGATHAVVGAVLCCRWGLPETLVRTIELHHHPSVTSLEEHSPRIRELTGVVFIANQLSKMCGCHGDDREIDLATPELLKALDLSEDYDQLLHQLLPDVQRPLEAFLNETLQLTPA